ncbi:MAG: hypothetical protein KGR24_05880 [Planctomycetes bacterium]|nr:hypothetical protein [Planctomycetota bacterium]
MWYMVYDAATGREVSLGTVIADPLPQGLASVTLSDADAAAIRDGRAAWDSETLGVVMLPPVVPESVTPYQFRVALLRAGVSLAQVDSLIDALPQPQRGEARVAWEYGLEVRRDHPLIAQFAAALGMDDAAIDAAFIEAAGL